MIYAESTEYANSIRLKIIYPGRKKNEFADLPNYAEANRFMYIRNRKYVIDELTSFLRQRQVGLQRAGQVDRSNTAAKVLVVLDYYKQATLPAVCRVVTDHSAAIAFLAPSINSKFYAHYQRVVLQIIQFCNTMNEGQGHAN